jgi:hypothetical protein
LTDSDLGQRGELKEEEKRKQFSEKASDARGRLRATGATGGFSQGNAGPKRSGSVGQEKKEPAKLLLVMRNSLLSTVQPFSLSSFIFHLHFRLH